MKNYELIKYANELDKEWNFILELLEHFQDDETSRKQLTHYSIVYFNYFNHLIVWFIKHKTCNMMKINHEETWRMITSKTKFMKEEIDNEYKATQTQDSCLETNQAPKIVI